jgi:hypothetical protein
MGTATARVRMPISDLAIEEWVCERYGFAPHPFWISDCKEFYLKAEHNQPLDARHKCPPAKRLMIREAFVYFGLLPE